MREVSSVNTEAEKSTLDFVVDDMEVIARRVSQIIHDIASISIQVVCVNGVIDVSYRVSTSNVSKNFKSWDTLIEFVNSKNILSGGI